jgi:Ca2+-binding RTX toxin-like protein
VGDDVITGSGSWPSTSVYGDIGDDMIDLRASTGININLYGDDGNDRLYAGSWGNNLYGGAGSDRMRVGDDRSYAVDTETDFITGAAHDKGRPRPSGLARPQRHRQGLCHGH